MCLIKDCIFYHFRPTQCSAQPHSSCLPQSCSTARARPRSRHWTRHCSWLSSATFATWRSTSSAPPATMRTNSRPTTGKGWEERGSTDDYPKITLLSESAAPVPSRRAVFLQHDRNAQPDGTDLGGRTPAGRYRRRRGHRRFADGRKRSHGHEPAGGVCWEQGTLVEHRRTGHVAAVPDGAEYTEGVQPGPVRVSDHGHAFDAEGFAVKFTYT